VTQGLCFGYKEQLLFTEKKQDIVTWIHMDIFFKPLKGIKALWGLPANKTSIKSYCEWQ